MTRPNVAPSHRLAARLQRLADDVRTADFYPRSNIVADDAWRHLEDASDYAAKGWLTKSHESMALAGRALDWEPDGFGELMLELELAGYDAEERREAAIAEMEAVGL